MSLKPLNITPPPWYQVEEGCPGCGGAGYTVIHQPECPDEVCDACIQTYVEQLEQIVNDCFSGAAEFFGAGGANILQRDNYSKKTLSFVLNKVASRQADKGQ